jgi:hypothetical protein
LTHSISQTFLGDCSAFVGCEEASFDRMRNSQVRKLPRHLPFGRAEKLVDLYVKTGINQRDLLTSRQAQHISKCARGPIDSRVLNRLGDKDEFREKMEHIGIRKNTPLQRIEPNQYAKSRNSGGEQRRRPTPAALPATMTSCMWVGSVNRP